jgi:hypothetical protein
MRQIVGYTSDSLWLDALRDGRAFAKSAFVGALAGNFSEVQLKNPAASGVAVLLFRSNVVVGAGGNMVMRHHEADLVTDTGTGVNLLAAGAVSAAHFRTAQVAAMDGTQIISVDPTVQNFSQGLPSWLVEIAPGEGAVFTTGAVNVNIGVAVFWLELPA